MTKEQMGTLCPYFFRVGVKKLELKLSFGILAPKIHEQLIVLGLQSNKVLHYEKIRESVNYLRLHNFATDMQAQKMYQKLINMISKEVKIDDKRTSESP